MFLNERNYHCQSYRLICLTAVGKHELIGCLLLSLKSLFPACGGGGAIAAMVEEHIGLIGLELVF